MRHWLRYFRLRFVIQRYEAIIVGSVLLLSGVAVPASWYPPMKMMLPPAPKVDVPTIKHPWIALTFDDGPHPGMTDRLLEVLREQNVPSTFFIVGKMGDRYPELVRTIAAQGHEVANHTYNHPNLARSSKESVMDELDRTRTLIHQLTGQDNYLFRPPGGDYSRDTVKLTASAGYRMILWSVLTDDVDGASCRAMRRRILDGASDGGIILMHSGVENTVKMLPGVIAELKGRGYQFVTVSTMLGLHKAHPANQHRDTPMLQTASISNPVSTVVRIQ